VGQTHEFYVILTVRTQTPNRNSHAVFKIAVQTCLRAIFFLEIIQKLFRCTGQAEFLRFSAKVIPAFNDFINRNFLFIRKEDRCNMTISDRNSQALRCDIGGRSVDNRTVFNMTPDFSSVRFLIFLLLRR
jgi:hypothetical protein